MPTAFVTGSTGFVGLNLVRLLEERGWDVVAFHRPTSDVRWLEGIRARRAVGDVGDADSVRSALPEGVDAVFHVAASTNMWSRRNAAQTRTNVDGTRHVAEAALARGARRLIHTSSIAAWGVHDDPVDETTPQRGAESRINYVRTKALAETEVRGAIARGLDAVIVNPSNILGPFDTSGWATMIRLAHAGRLPGAPPGRGSFCHVREVCRAHLTAFERAGTGQNFLLGGTDADYIELVREVCRLAGRRPPSRAMPAWALKTYARAATAVARVTGRRPAVTPESAALVTARLLCSSETAERELGYRPVPLAEMVGDAWSWLRGAGLLGG